MGSNNEPNTSAIMTELQHIREAIEGNSRQLERITHELAGNGGPGIRTRIHALETGYNHVVDRLRHIEEDGDKQRDCINKLEKQIIAMRNIGVGVVVSLAALEALRWIVPLLATP